MTVATHNRQAACLGKDRFATMALAREVALRPRKRGHSLVAYRCQCCGGFHVGSPTREPNGRLSRRAEDRRERDDMTEIEAKSVVIEARVRHGIPRHLADLQDAGRANAGTVHGRMRLSDDPTCRLTADQFAAAEWWLGRRLEYLRAIGAERVAYDEPAGTGTGGVTISEANAAWRRIIEVLQTVSTEHRSPVLAAFDTILARQAFVPHLVGDLRLGLNAIHRVFLVGRRRVA